MKMTNLFAFSLMLFAPVSCNGSGSDGEKGEKTTEELRREVIRKYAG